MVVAGGLSCGIGTAVYLYSLVSARQDEGLIVPLQWKSVFWC